MKRLLALLLSLIMVFSVTAGVFANSQITLNCHLSCDGQTEVTKKTGDIVTVTYTLKNTTNEADYIISSHTNEIYYDPAFFEYVDGSAKVSEGLNLGSGHQVWSDPKKRSVAFAGAEFGEKYYNANQVIGTFDLKVIAEKGSSTIYSARYGIASISENYTIEETDLVVKIGDAVVIPKYQLKFETNGGTEIAAVKADQGTTVELKDYKPVRKNYNFDGWYSDIGLTKEITSVLMDENKTVYAKWTKESSGGGGGGGGGGGTVISYKIVFDTDDGSIINDLIKSANSTVDLTKYVPKKDGYDFDGWYTDKELKNKVTSIKVTENITLYAKWSPSGDGNAASPDYVPGIFAKDHIAYIVGRDGGYIAPNENLTRAEAATIFFRLIDPHVRTEGLTEENNFSDVSEGDWFNTAVSTLTKLEILKGRTNDTFAPNETITRAELTTIVARLADTKYDGGDMFSDISGHWAKDYINIAASIGWVQGDGGKFRPDDNITRAETMAIINRTTNRLPETKEDLLPGMQVFVDNADEGAWYYLHIQEATTSHDYELKADGVYEKWTTINENPDWTQIEK